MTSPRRIYTKILNIGIDSTTPIDTWQAEHIKAQRDEIIRSKAELESKNTNITDSIT